MLKIVLSLWRCHHSYITWVSWRLKSPNTRLFVRQLVQLHKRKHHTSTTLTLTKGHRYGKHSHVLHALNYAFGKPTGYHYAWNIHIARQCLSIINAIGTFKATLKTRIGSFVTIMWSCSCLRAYSYVRNQVVLRTWKKISQVISNDYSDVTCANSPVTRLFFFQEFTQTNLAESIKSRVPDPLWKEPYGGKWIPLTKGQ